MGGAVQQMRSIKFGHVCLSISHGLWFSDVKAAGNSKSRPVLGFLKFFKFVNSFIVTRLDLVQVFSVNATKAGRVVPVHVFFKVFSVSIK